MLEVDLPAMRQLVEKLNYRPLFVTVSGAHLYGFPSADSDVDLRGCHQLPLRDIVGLDTPDETVERETIVDGTEVELVSHEIAKYLRLLVRHNGYILEQILSPIVVTGQKFLDELRPLAVRCITRHHYHHYRGFYATQRKLLEKENPKRAKPLLYAYRVLMTGIHLLRTGEIEANLPHLNEHFHLPFLNELMDRKIHGENISAGELDWQFHESQLAALETALDRAFEDSQLPADPDRAAINELLVRLRLCDTSAKECP
jgi:predicted nucleotidyltransferase